MLHEDPIVDYTPSLQYWHWYQQHMAATRMMLWLSAEFHQDPRQYGHMLPPAAFPHAITTLLTVILYGRP